MVAEQNVPGTIRSGMVPLSADGSRIGTKYCGTTWMFKLTRLSCDHDQSGNNKERTSDFSQGKIFAEQEV
jgi:hypothetical protein